jgi:hypothetical protein
MASFINKLIHTPNALVLIAAVVLCLVAIPAVAQVTPTPAPTQTPTPESTTSEPPRGIADLLVVQSGGGRNTLYVADKKAGAIYSRPLDGSEKGRISLSDFKRFHVSPQFNEPSGLAYLGGKLLVSDTDHDVLVEVDLKTKAERVLLRKGDVGGFAAPTSVAVSLRGAIAVASTEAHKVWVRQPGALPGAFIATPLPAGVGPTRLFFIQSDLFVVDENKVYRLVASEAGPGVVRVATGFIGCEDIVYYGDLLFAVDNTGVWVQPYSPTGTPETGTEQTPRVSRLNPEGKYKLSRVAVTADTVFAGDADDMSVRIFARPPSVARLRLQGEYLYWLEAFTNRVFRMKRGAGTLPAPERLWSGGRLEEASGLAIDDAGTIYIVDRKSPAIYSLTAGGTPSVIYTGKLLEAPTDIAAGEGVLYVLDSGSRKLLSFNLARKEVVEEYVYEQGPVPDRLNYHKDNLLAFATNDNVLDRFVIAGELHAGDGGPNAEWHIALGRGHGTVRRAQRFQLRKALNEVIDFDHVENVVYFLDAGQKRLVLMPLAGGEPTSIAYDDLARTPTAIAADEKEMFLVDGYRRRFNRAPALLPITVEYEGKWTPTKLVNLYTYLLDQRLLPKRLAVFPQQTPLETLALETMPTGDYVGEFRDLFCRLNSALCKTWTAAPQSAAGSELIPANREVIVPDLRIEPYSTQRLITLPLDTEKSYRTAFFKKYVNGPLGELALEFLPDGVDRTELPKRLSELNPHYKGDITAATTGDFVIPIKAARVYAAAARADVLNVQSRLNNILKEDNVTAFSPALPQPQAVPPRGAGSSQAAALLAARSPAARPALDPRCKTLLPGVTSNAMEIVNYCFPKKLLDPDAAPPPQVGVIDNFFNYKHPIFGGEQSTAVQVYKDENATVEVDPSDERTPESTTFLEIDHGTHMAALIGALEQENVMTGFYPRARIQAFPVTSQLSGAMDRFRTLGLFNLSLGEKSAKPVGPKQPFVETAPLIKLIKNFPLPLFVVSAGNDNQLIHENTLASFGYIENVLVVGATNSPTPDPQNQERPPIAIWVNSKEEGSSFHQELVGVVAPGEGIKSALWNNGYGTADGTSPATAIVTGAAAVLMNVTELSWAAWQIKFRLIASADLWTDKELKQNLFPKVFSGVLNMRRAVLDTGVAVADHQTNGVCKGRIPVEELDKELKIRQSGGRAPLEIKLRHILRIARSGESKYTIIYYEQKRLIDKDGKQGRMNYWLKRVLDVEVFDLLESSNLFRFDVSQETTNCRSGGWNLITLKDFLNTFYPEPEPDTQLSSTP